MIPALSSFLLTDKVIIVTGASSGIGKEISVYCSKLGATVILLGRDKSRLENTFSELEGTGHNYFTVDINDFTAVEGIVKEIVSLKGKISGLVNCAGVSPTIPFKVISSDKMLDVLKTNVVASMNITKVVCKATNISDNASIVFIASVMGSVGETGKSLYGMTKGALIAGMKSLAVEYASKKIRFNTISPGVVVTPMSMSSEYSKDPDKLNYITSLHPLGLGMPENIAHGAAYLLSGASAWVTGTDLVIDGGYTAK